jgi:hypothetical protein
MKNLLLILLLWNYGILGTSAADQKTWEASVTLKSIEYDSEILGTWSLRGWEGYMGIVLSLEKDNMFSYWFYSDVVTGDEPKYPIKGKYKIEYGCLVLETEARVYDTRWVLLNYGGKTGLFPYSGFETIIMRKETPDTRMLFRLPTKKASDYKTKR